MAKKKLSAEKNYTLEKTGDDEVTLHYALQRSPFGAPKRWAAAGVMAIPFGVVPAVFITAILSVAFTDEPPLWLNFIWWAAVIVFCFWKARKAWVVQSAHGAPLTKIIFTRDEIHTPLDTILGRSDIASSYSREPDTTFTYRGNTEYQFKQAEAKRKQNTAIEVGVDYGAKEVAVTPKALSPNQGEAIANAIARWINDPERLFEEAAA